jgi:hypothetical protein
MFYVSRSAPIRRLPLRLSLAITLLTASSACDSDTAITDTCALRYPIVLSHHWSAIPICADPLPSELCDRLQPARLCADWRFNDAIGREECHEWRVPEDERHLPPRNVNAHDPALQRDLDTYHRYYSKDIVDRLESCGNQVYLSDKPAYASYAVRARSLRNTVLAALADSGAERVHLLGMSQGVQDARRMTAALPVDDGDPGQGWMRDRVASVVSVVGEDQGAESASLLLALMAGEDASDWSVPSSLASPPEEDMRAVLWSDTDAIEATAVLVEGYDAGDPAEYGMGPAEAYRAYVHSVADLSVEYMTGDLEAGFLSPDAWASLRAYLATDEAHWLEAVPPTVEHDNGVAYLSYAAMIRWWDPDAWGADLAFSIVRALYGDNDGYVTVASQSFADEPHPNFHHVKTMAGDEAGRGYHHMYFGGRNDAVYGPREEHMEPSPYGGSSADFYEQVARDMAQRGL